jgi:hypothetical protein
MKTQLVALALCTSLAYANPIHIIQGNTPKIFLQYDRNPQLEPMVQRIQRLAKAKYGTELPDAKPVKVLTIYPVAYEIEQLKFPYRIYEEVADAR